MLRSLSPSPKSSDVLRMSFAMLLAVMPVGCGYQIGSPYPAEYRSIHVPTFTSESFRRGFELQLTEAVQKQIQDRTPFRLANDGNADTRLTGNIVSIDKRPVNQNKYDDPRELEMGIAVEVVWEDLRSGRVLAQRTVPIDARVAHLVVNTSFAPESGQSWATATQDAVDQLASEIVGMMETPW